MLNISQGIDREMISQLRDAVGDASFARLRDTCIANGTARLDALLGKAVVVESDVHLRTGRAGGRRVIARRR